MSNGRSPEPLSREALRVLRRWPAEPAEIDRLFRFMRTARTARVYDQLKRYCQGEQDGVSILIAGTRGMGKTTMTKLVVQMLIAQDDGLVPLPLVLHGPTLLRPDEDGVVENPSVLSPQAAREREKVRLKQWVLRGLIAALYRHVCAHIVQAWENALVIEPPKWQVLGRFSRPTRELEQLRGHLDLGLDHAPSVTALRQIWRRAKFLRSGVLPMLYPCQKGRRWPRDQGIREIVAIAACAHSYLTVLGDPEETFSSRTRAASRGNVRKIAGLVMRTGARAGPAAAMGARRQKNR
jgi:hypothetical protein